MGGRTAREAAESLLARRAYTEQGLLEKLMLKGYEEQDAQHAVERLMSQGYLNDESYARDMAERLKRRGYGIRRVQQALRAKGVDGELAGQVLEDSGNDGAEEHIDRLLRKLSKGRPLDAKEKARLSAALFRRGFEADDIRNGLRRFAAALEYSEEDL